MDLSLSFPTTNTAAASPYDALLTKPFLSLLSRAPADAPRQAGKQLGLESTVREVQSSHPVRRKVPGATETVPIDMERSMMQTLRQFEGLHERA